MLVGRPNRGCERSKRNESNSDFIFVVSLVLFCSCQNEANIKLPNTDENSTKNSTEDLADTSSFSMSETNGKPYIIDATLYNNNWYVPDASNDTQYFSFTNSKIYYNFSYNKNSTFSGLGASKVGNLTFLNKDLSKFEYRWDGSISGSEKIESVLIIDKDVLVVNNGLDCTNEIGKTHICYKDLTAYTDSIPFMGFGKTAQNSYSEWFIFTPSGICYKRYLNSQTNELLIVNGTWEKTGQTYKIYWSKNKDRYDLLKGTKLYQNASENNNSVPIGLCVCRY